MEKKVCEVKKIVLNIDGKEISLTMEQAKKLKDILGELFGKEIIKEVIREIHDNYPIYPWVYEPQTPLNPPWTITCGGTKVTYSDNTRSINFTL